MGYTDGAHDDNVDTYNRLTRVGSRFYTSYPTVSDGENAYLNIDSSGRPRISGSAAHDAAATGNPVRIGGVYRSTIPVLTTGDVGDLLLDAAGRIRLAFEANVFKMISAVAITAGTPAVVWTPAIGKKVRLLGWSLSASAAARLQFEDSGAAGVVIMQSPLLAIAGIDTKERLGEGVLLGAADNTLKLNVSATATVSGMVWGVEE